MDASHFGPVLGAYYLVQIFLAPVIGKLISRIGLGIAFKCSLVGFVISGTCYGLITYIDDQKLFLFTAYSIRLAIGFCINGVWSSILSLLLAK